MKTGYLHALSALVLAFYLYRVNERDKNLELYALAKRDAESFLTWGIASALIIYATSRMGPLGEALGGLIVASAALTGGPRVIEGFRKVIGG